ncbi:MAG: hypothetical protein ABR925_01800 [Acidimicrobiales bacterium]|jgi:hypothetical protein
MTTLTKKVRMMAVGGAVALTVGGVGAAAAVASTSAAPLTPYKICATHSGVLMPVNTSAAKWACPSDSTLVTINPRGAGGAIAATSITDSGTFSAGNGAFSVDSSGDVSIGGVAYIGASDGYAGFSGGLTAEGGNFVVGQGADVSTNGTVSAAGITDNGSLTENGPSIWTSGTINSYDLDVSTQTGVPITAADMITNRIAVAGPVTDANGCTIYGEFQCGILHTDSAANIEDLIPSPVVDDTFSFSIENINNAYAAEILGGTGVTMDDTVPALTTTTFVCQITAVSTPAITCY